MTTRTQSVVLSVQKRGHTLPKTLDSALLQGPHYALALEAIALANDREPSKSRDREVGYLHQLGPCANCGQFVAFTTNGISLTAISDCEYRPYGLTFDILVPSGKLAVVDRPNRHPTGDYDLSTQRGLEQYTIDLAKLGFAFGWAEAPAAGIYRQPDYSWTIAAPVVHWNGTVNPPAGRLTERLHLGRGTFCLTDEDLFLSNGAVGENIQFRMFVQPGRYRFSISPQVRCSPEPRVYASFGRYSSA